MQTDVTQTTCESTARERYAGVHVLDNPLCLDGVFHYAIPPAMTDAVVRGAFVTVPFGKGNRKLLAVVVDVVEADGLPAELPRDRVKPVFDVCRAELSLDELQLGLCRYLKDTTLCTMGEAVRTVVPPAALASLTEYYRAVPEDRLPAKAGRVNAVLPAADLMVYEYLVARGSVSGQAIRARFGASGIKILERFCRRGIVERELVVRRPAVPTERYYTLAVPTEAAEASLRGDKDAVRVTSQAHKDILRLLITAGGRLSARVIEGATNANGAQMRALVKKGLLFENQEEMYRRPTGGLFHGERTPMSLSDEQAAAVKTLTELADSGEPKAALVHGVTGSGKTCVILEMIDRMLDRGRGVIVLLPEIGLTPQMLGIFEGRYGDRVAVIHSGLSAGERLDSYRRIRDGVAPVVVGTRSAVFAPMPKLGMIVMDEEQEHTYKSDMDPKYHARDIARYRCATENALLLLASATPSLESYHKAMEGKYTLITLKHRYGNAVLPAVRVVDMRGEPENGNTSPIGSVLTEELRRVKSADEQAVLFLNRRGYSNRVVCRSCGKAVSCSRCSVAMSHHVGRGRGERGELVCHWCGERRPYPSVCPDCGSPHLSRMGYGTQRVEEELSSLVPDVRILRMDADTTTTKSAYNDLLGSFRRREADILLGTQMVTKGHDFPDVTLVGVLMADASLYLDDYRAAERTFSLLTQVIGRAGRAEKEGLAIIQTMNPDSDVIGLACAQDYETFYHREIRLRKLLGFPPFCDMVLLTVTGENEAEVHRACTTIAEDLTDLCEEKYTDVPLLRFGPFEAPVYRVDNVYRMRLVLKCRLNRRARALISELVQNFDAAVVNRSRSRPSLSVDFNPSGI